MAELNVDNLQTEIKSVIAEIVEVDPEEVTLEVDFVNDLGMDSMQALEIMATIEKKFQIRIPEDELVNIRNLGSAIDIAKKYLKVS